MQSVGAWTSRSRVGIFSPAYSGLAAELGRHAAPAIHHDRMLPARLAVVSVVLALQACQGGARPAAEPEEEAAAARATIAPSIFRHVQLNAGRIQLAEPVPAPLWQSLGAAAGDTVVSLPRGTFTGAERVTLYLTRERVVRGVSFDYIHSADFEAMVREYGASLGAPARATRQHRGEVPADVATWDDGRTRFRITRDPNRSAWTVRSELRDLTLSGP